MASMKWASTYFTLVLLVGILFGTAVDIAAAELHGLCMEKLIGKLAIMGFLLHGLWIT